MPRIVLDADFPSYTLRDNSTMNQITEGILWILLLLAPGVAYTDYYAWLSLQEQALYWHTGLPTLQDPNHLVLSGLYHLLLLIGLITFYSWTKGMESNTDQLFQNRLESPQRIRPLRALIHMFYPKRSTLQSWAIYRWYLRQHGYLSENTNLQWANPWWFILLLYGSFLFLAVSPWIESTPIQSQITGQVVQTGVDLLAIPGLICGIILLRRMQHLEDKVRTVYPPMERKAAQYRPDLQIGGK